MMFQIDPPEIYYGSGIVPFLNNLEASGAWKPSAKSIFILEGDSAYSQAISGAAKDAIDKDGTWELVGVEPVVTGTTDWGPQISKVASANPGVVMNTHWVPAELAAFTKQWVQNPTNSLVYLQYGASVPQYAEIAGEAANGIDLGDGHRRLQRRARKAVSAAVPGQVGQARRVLELRLRVRRGLPAGAAWGATATRANFKANIDLAQEHDGRCAASTGATGTRGTPGTLVSIYPDLSPDPCLGQAHLFFQFQELQHKIIQPAPYIETTFQNRAVDEADGLSRGSCRALLRRRPEDIRRRSSPWTASRCRSTQGHILGIAGPNGAGKTTLFDVLSGTRQPDARHVELGGRRHHVAATPKRVRLGLARTFQSPLVPTELTVGETLQAARDRLPAARRPRRWRRPANWSASTAPDRAVAGGLDTLERRKLLLACLLHAPAQRPADGRALRGSAGQDEIDEMDDRHPADDGRELGMRGHRRRAPARAAVRGREARPGAGRRQA